MRTVGKLAPNAVNKIAKPGRYGDGAGLYLVVSRSGTKAWGFRYMLRGRPHELGLGSSNTFTLAEARERARNLRQQLADGVDPLASRAAAKREAAPKKTFREVAALYVEAYRPSWRNAAHATQWDQSLRDYILPVLGEMAVDAVGTGDVMNVLQPIWHEKPETASRVRQRIETILNYATTSEWRQGDNPARWRGHLENKLPKPTDIKARLHEQKGSGGHHAAMDWREVPCFVAKLRDREGIAARALRFLILTAGSSGAVRRAEWNEIQDGVWTLPAAPGRKVKKPHSVPLSDAALTALPQRSTGLIFPGQDGRKPVTDAALNKLLPSNSTLHGFRAAFKTWCSEMGHPDDLSEAALPHTQGKLHDAYQRGPMLERRRKLMQAWADYCVGGVPAGNVIPIRAAG